MTLHGVNHTARPTWKLAETVAFYKDVLGLPLVHCVSARGWGPANHPDFLHFFFDSGNGSTIAFFYYIGDDQPEHLVHRPEYDNDAIHTAWTVQTRDELLAWRAQIESRGVKVMFQIEHEVIESIYFRDPNGYLLEITMPLRAFRPIDGIDAELTLQAAIEQEARRNNTQQPFEEVEAVWRSKGDMVRKLVANTQAAVH
ncbi:MAG: VOC family protein [Polaromonas sp.]|nr:VOC family protein [Polaromonas sp.]